MSLRAEATAAAELTDPEVRTAAMAAVQERVTARVPAARLQQQIKRLWPRRLGSPEAGDHVYLLDLAYDLVLFARDPKGRNAFDRLARARPFPAGSAEAAALELMRGARPVAMEVMDVDMLGRVEARDLVSDERVHLDACVVAPGDRLFGRIARLSDGQVVDIGPLLRLPDATWPTLDRHLQDTAAGTFKRPERSADAVCAAAVTAAVETFGRLGDICLDLFQVETTGPADVAFVDGGWRTGANTPEPVRKLLGLADRWAARDSAAPERADPAGARWVRGHVTPNEVYCLAALSDHVPADHPQLRAIEALMRVALDTIGRRAEVGLGDGMAALERELDRPGEGLTETAWARLQRLRAQVGGRAAAPDPDLDRVIARIKALQAKTQAAGCTEAEAMAAAEKAEELLRRYDIDQAPAIAESACVLARIPTDRKRRDGLDACGPAIATFTACRHWLQEAADGRLTHVFFGMPADIEAARVLYDVIAETFAVETAAFKAGGTYRATPSPDRGQATKSFRYGLADGICGKLHALADQRAQQTQHSTGRDLVPLKAEAIDEALERLGIAFRSKSAGKRYVDPDAYARGRTSGAAFQPERAVDGSAERATG